MVSSVPGYLAWPVLAFTAVVLVLRYALCNASLVEKYLNNTLALCLACNLLRERIIVDFLADHHVAYKISEALSGVSLNLAFIEFLGFTALWSGSSQQTARRNHQRYRVAAIIFMVPLFIFRISDYVPPGNEVQGASNLWLAASVLVMVLPALLVIQTLRLAVREWRRGDVKQRERIVTAGLVSVGLALLLGCVITAVSMFSGSHPPVEVVGHSVFWLITAYYTLATIPVIRTLIAYAGLDRNSRDWYALQELQCDLAAAVPETVFDTTAATWGRQKGALDLHQSIVQIRDGILLLRPYFGEVTEKDAARLFPPDARWRTGQREAAIQALQIAVAIRAKREGRVSPQSPGGAIRSNSSPANLAEEVAELVRVCKWWPAVRPATHPPTETMARSAP